MEPLKRISTGPTITSVKLNKPLSWDRVQKCEGVSSEVVSVNQILALNITIWVFLSPRFYPSGLTEITSQERMAHFFYFPSTPHTTSQPYLSHFFGHLIWPRSFSWRRQQHFLFNFINIAIAFSFWLFWLIFESPSSLTPLLLLFHSKSCFSLPSYTADKVASGTIMSGLLATLEFVIPHITFKTLWHSWHPACFSHPHFGTISPIWPPP